MKWIGQYTNGNASVSIASDGTRIMETNDDEFDFAFPNSMDIKCTNRCDRNCLWCHENSTPDGLHGNILNEKFIDTLRPYTEVALGGGNILSHPHLEEFLMRLKERQVIANITINYYHFVANIHRLRVLRDSGLIFGLGVSVERYCEEQFINSLKEFPNAVLHVINGIISIHDLAKYYDHDLKLLILGYKCFRRGTDFYDRCRITVDINQMHLKQSLTQVIRGFKVVSFDNLALEQLDVKGLLTEEQWDRFFQGEDGNGNLYLDLVNRKFALSSRHSQTYDMMDSIDDMYAVIKQLAS